MSFATIYKIPKKGYIIHSDRKTISGFRIAFEPFIKVPEDFDNPDDIVNSIIAGLNYDDLIRLPDPQNFNVLQKNYLSSIGLKSLGELHRPLVKNVSIKKENEKIIFTPSKHAKKPEKGFLYKGKDEAVTVLASDRNSKILEALKIAFAKCE